MPIPAQPKEEMGGLLPNGVFESLLDGLNTGIFVEQRHADNTAGICVDEEREPQPRGLLPCLLIHDPGIEEPVIGKHILKRELRTMDKGIKHQVELLPHPFPKALGNHGLALVRLRFNVLRIGIEPGWRRHLNRR